MKSPRGFRKGTSSRSDASSCKSKVRVEGDEDEYTTQSPSPSPCSSRVRDRKFDVPDMSSPPAPQDAGYPGHLSTEQKSVLYQFAREVKKRGPEGRQAVLCFGESEPEEFALCRFLRARKFVMEDAKDMLEQAMAMHLAPRAHDYYRNAQEALGVEEAVFKTQYPQVFSGHAKNGCPLFISKTGALNVDGLDCVTSADQMHSYQWHFMVHIAAQRFRERKEADPTFNRFQTFCIFDLEGLSRQSINSAVLSLVKHQTKIIKHWLDPFTASKIEIYSNRSKWEERIKEFVDIDQIPLDYGGNASSVADLLLKSGPDTGINRRITQLMSLTKRDQVTMELRRGESMDVLVYTRSVIGADFCIASEEDAALNSEPSNTHVGAEESSDRGQVNFVRETIATGLVGPGIFTVVGCLSKGKRRFSMQNEHFLVVGNIKKIPVSNNNSAVWTGRVFHVPVSIRVEG